jgi:hypothetical protein
MVTVDPGVSLGEALFEVGGELDVGGFGHGEEGDRNFFTLLVKSEVEAIVFLQVHEVRPSSQKITPQRPKKSGVREQDCRKNLGLDHAQVRQTQDHTCTQQMPKRSRAQHCAQAKPTKHIR